MITLYNWIICKRKKDNFARSRSHDLTLGVFKQWQRWKKSALFKSLYWIIFFCFVIYMYLCFLCISGNNTKMSESQCSINPAVFGIAVFLLQSLFTLKFEKKSNILISLISFKMMPPSLSTFSTLIFLFIDEDDFLYCFEDYLITILILCFWYCKDLQTVPSWVLFQSSILSSIFFTLLSSSRSVTSLSKLSDIIL